RWCMARHGVLHLAFYEMKFGLRVARGFQVPLYVFDAGDTPIVRRSFHFWAVGENVRGLLPIEHDILFRRGRHSLESIEQVKLPGSMVEFQESESDNHHAATAPDTTFDEITRYLVCDDVLYRIHQGGDSLGAGSSVVLHFVHHRQFRVVKA